MNIERPTSNFKFEKMKKQTPVLNRYSPVHQAHGFFNICFHSKLDVQRSNRCWTFVLSSLARIFHEPDRHWRKALQPEAVVIYCEG
jgi:hypothetical protein